MFLVRRRPFADIHRPPSGPAKTDIDALRSIASEMSVGDGYTCSFRSLAHERRFKNIQGPLLYVTSDN